MAEQPALPPAVMTLCLVALAIVTAAVTMPTPKPIVRIQRCSGKALCPSVVAWMALTLRGSAPKFVPLVVFAMMHSVLVSLKAGPEWPQRSRYN
jgi:hypothetical protein